MTRTSVFTQSCPWSGTSGQGAVLRPGRFGLHGATAHRLANDDAFRHDVTRGTMARASWLFPLSRLVYMMDGIEEIHVNRWDKWILTTSTDRMMLDGEDNPFQSDADVLTFFREHLVGAQ